MKNKQGRSSSFVLTLANLEDMLANLNQASAETREIGNCMLGVSPRCAANCRVLLGVEARALRALAHTIGKESRAELLEHREAILMLATRVEDGMYYPNPAAVREVVCFALKQVQYLLNNAAQLGKTPAPRPMTGREREADSKLNRYRERIKAAARKVHFQTEHTVEEPTLPTFKDVMTDEVTALTKAEQTTAAFEVLVAGLLPAPKTVTVEAPKEDPKVSAALLAIRYVNQQLAAAAERARASGFDIIAINAPRAENVAYNPAILADFRADAQDEIARIEREIERRSDAGQAREAQIAATKAALLTDAADLEQRWTRVTLALNYNGRKPEGLVGTPTRKGIDAANEIIRNLETVLEKRRLEGSVAPAPKLVAPKSIPEIVTRAFLEQELVRVNDMVDECRVLNARKRTMDEILKISDGDLRKALVQSVYQTEKHVLQQVHIKAKARDRMAPEPARLTELNRLFNPVVNRPAPVATTTPAPSTPSTADVPANSVAA